MWHATRQLWPRRRRRGSVVFYAATWWSMQTTKGRGGERLLWNQLRPVAGAGNLDCARSPFILGPEGPYAMLYTKIVKSKLLIFLDRHLTCNTPVSDEVSRSSITDNYPDKCQWFPSQEVTNWNCVSTISVLCSRSKQLSSGSSKYAQPRPPHAHDAEVSQNGPIRLTVTSELSQLWVWLNGWFPSLCLCSTAGT